jgi:hypothetical protein
MVATGGGSVLGSGNTLLHLALLNKSDDASAIVEYLCQLCPALIYMNSREGSPLHSAILYLTGRRRLQSVQSVVRDIDVPYQQLPLQLLIIESFNKLLEVSDEGDCFCLLLRLYSASAGVKDCLQRSPNSMAVRPTNL